MTKKLFDLTPKEIINKYALEAKKSLGQNFIINPSLTNKIANYLTPPSDGVIVEIGTGPLTLTRSIIEQKLTKYQKLVLIEKDRRFSKLFDQLILEYSNIEVFFTDILDFDLSKLGNNLTIISNLPYNISTAFLIKACFAYQNISQMVLMFQQEVADRIVAKNNSKKFGRLSIMAQTIFNIEKLLKVEKTAFSPAPKVTSAVLGFNKNIEVTNGIKNSLYLINLEKISKLIFSQRRKKIGTVFKNSSIESDILAKIKIDLNKRAEQLDLEEIKKLTIIFE